VSQRVRGADAAPAAGAPAHLVELRDVVKTYRRGHEEVRALRGVSLAVDPGELVVVTGPSGSGKSTLLHVMGGLDRPSSGEVLLGGRRVEDMTDDDLTLRRRREIGFIFQFFHLLPALTAGENVALPMLLEGRAPAGVRDEVEEALARVGLVARAGHRPRELSGGEQQRVAIARALVNRPSLVLADEPTGNLDSATGAEVLALLREASSDYGAAVVIVTHDRQAAMQRARTLVLRDGIVEAEPGGW
jgi:ABC-type lipoprotein export system ATPase subunit